MLVHPFQTIQKWSSRRIKSNSLNADCFISRIKVTTSSNLMKQSSPNLLLSFAPGLLRMSLWPGTIRKESHLTMSPSVASSLLVLARSTWTASTVLSRRRTSSQPWFWSNRFCPKDTNGVYSWTTPLIMEPCLSPTGAKRIRWRWHGTLHTDLIWWASSSSGVRPSSSTDMSWLSSSFKQMRLTIWNWPRIFACQ